MFHIRAAARGLAVLAASCAASACGEANPTPTAGPGCNSRISGGTVSAVIDGVAWSTASPTGSFLCDFSNGVTIYSSTPPAPYFSFSVYMVVLGNLEAGAYPVGGGGYPRAGASLERNDSGSFRSWLTGPLGSSGLATVSLVTRERVAGSFEFTLTPGALVKLPEEMRPISVTNGTFDIRF